MDIDRDTWCLSPWIVKAEIEKNCREEEGKLIHISTRKRVAALMPVYTLGNMPDMEAFRELADRYHIPLIVDAACAIGTTYKGKGFGPFADLSILSFNGNKTITCGGGGAVVGDNEELLDYVRHLTTTARIWPDYDFDQVGFNYRMTNIQAAVGCAQMERLDSFIKIKRYVREYYNSILCGILNIKGITFFPTTEGSSCWFSGIVLPEGMCLEEVKNVCMALREGDIEARSFWKPVHLQMPYRDCPRSDVKIAESLWQRIITLPCSTSITENELNKVVDTLKRII